jgi:hypothetical protein
MKKIILTSLAILFSATFSFGQNKEVKINIPKVTLCNAVNDNDSISYVDFCKCAELHQPLEGWTIKSFQYSIYVNGAYLDLTNIGSKFSNRGLELLKHSDKMKSKKLLINQVIVKEVNGNKQRAIKGIEVILKY